MFGDTFSQGYDFKENSILQECYDNFILYSKNLVVKKEDGTIDELRSALWKRREKNRVIDAYKGIIKELCTEDYGYITDKEANTIINGIPYRYEGRDTFSGWRQFKNDEINIVMNSVRKNSSKDYQNNYLDDLFTRRADEIDEMEWYVKSRIISHEESIIIKKEIDANYLFEKRFHLSKVVGDYNISDKEVERLTERIQFTFNDENGHIHYSLRAPTDSEVRERYQAIKQETVGKAL